MLNLNVLITHTKAIPVLSCNACTLRAYMHDVHWGCTESTLH